MVLFGVIRILLAEDVELLRSALVGLLSLEDDIQVVAELASGALIVPTALEVQPDVAVLDIDLPEVDGLTAAERLRERLPGCRVLILTGLNRPGQLRRALAAQVAGFLPKDVRHAELADAIRTVASGDRVLDPALTAAALEASASPLSQRETMALRLSATGASPGEIAEQLFLTPGTVRNYLTSAATKLDARNRVDAIRIATEAGWI
ncbi:two component transcriptional regulator, LuxR family [Microbispora rosea]|uniref:Two component transcriptional regulator, LuxR family n=1 Tax=Microbispora rosea TaxID=58117 RepID=A0A1N6Z7S3_9ACTN|nr:DNA-binding response regulator [Microbispora rosea subsp. rosea]SIR22888.1 two component transcriptional regulator, LuxR family [Microbispora rosea]